MPADVGLLTRKPQTGFNVERSPTMKRTILLKPLILAAVIGATTVATSAPAGPPAEQGDWTFYYIVQNPATSRCMVTDVKPTPDGVAAIAYETRALAERALAEASAHAVPDCSTARRT